MRRRVYGFLRSSKPSGSATGAKPFGAFLPLAPLLAALVVTGVIDGRPGLRALGRRMLRWRVAKRWYAVALALPLAAVIGAITLDVALGAPASALHGLDPWYILVLAFAVRLINPLDGPSARSPAGAASPWSACRPADRRCAPA